MDTETRKVETLEVKLTNGDTYTIEVPDPESVTYGDMLAISKKPDLEQAEDLVLSITHADTNARFKSVAAASFPVVMACLKAAVTFLAEGKVTLKSWAIS